MVLGIELRTSYIYGSMIGKCSTPEPNPRPESPGFDYLVMGSGLTASALPLDPCKDQREEEVVWPDQQTQERVCSRETTSSTFFRVSGNSFCLGDQASVCLLHVCFQV